MVFSSYEFIFLFLPITLLIFFQIGGRGYYQIANAWLVAASVIFYAWWNPAYLVIMVGSILFNYFIGLSISRSSQSTLLGLTRKSLLTLGIIGNIALLGYYKYTNFLLSTTNKLLGTSFNLQNIILPLAISFFTFTQIAYLVDVYRQEAKENNAESNSVSALRVQESGGRESFSTAATISKVERVKPYSFLNYCQFITFFPHLLAGPIVHHKELIPQFENKAIYTANIEDIAVGLTIFASGLFKKVVFADSIAVYAIPVFEGAATGGSPTFFEAWGGAIAYSLQLYFDFSGYSDMAIGAARMFGIKFPLNFNSPYKSLNIIEFWRRWHVTLSHFLRDYLYIPLGGNRKGKLRRYINLTITMLLGGLWHGAGWTFVLWGGLHGIYLVINHQWHGFRKSLGHDLNKTRWWSRALSCLVTFAATVVAWVLFRAKNMTAAIAILKGMVGVNGIAIPEAIVNQVAPIKPSLTALGVTFLNEGGQTMMLTYFWILALLFVVWFTPNTQEWLERYNPALDHVVKTPGCWSDRFWQKLQWQPNKIWSICVGAIFGLGIIYLVRPTEFLYFNF